MNQGLSLLLHFVLSIFTSSFVQANDGLSSLPFDDVNHNLFSSTSYNQQWVESKFPTAVASDIDEQCLSDTKEYLAAYQSRQLWAIQMYESSGRFEEELIFSGTGNIYHDNGLFDECISVRPNNVAFQGQYCTVFFGLNGISPKEVVETYQNVSSLASDEIRHSKEGEPNENVSAFQMPSISFCLPSTCNASQLRWAIAQRIGQRFIDDKNVSLVAITNDQYCYTQEGINMSRKLDNLTIAVLVIFGLLGLFSMTATVHEIWRERCGRIIQDAKEHTIVRILHSFSGLRNFKAMLSTRAEFRDVNLSSLHGIRFFTTCWIIMLHTSEEFASRNSYNKKTALENVSRVELQGLINGSISVDTFFFMSGLLVTFSQMAQLDRSKGIFNFKRFYIRRYIRLTPMYAAVLALLATLYPYLGIGPDWNYIRVMSQTVRKNFWTNMLYINNYVPKIEHCMNNPLTGMAESWYLACDMQMFWISPLFIYPLWRWRKAGVAWVVTSFTLLIGALMAIFVIQDLPPAVIFSRPTDIKRVDEYCTQIYLQTYARIPPYIVGIIFGCILHRTKTRKLHINKYIIAAGWTLASLTGLSVTYGMVPYLDEVQVPYIHSLVRVLYGSLHRASWAVAVGWLVFACTHGYGGFVQRWLSWRCFVPLARLSYSVFLIHFAFVKAYTSQQRKPFYFTEFNFVANYVGTVAFTFILATVLCTAIELPFHNLDKLIFPNKSKPTTTPAVETARAEVVAVEEEVVQMEDFPKA